MEQNQVMQITPYLVGYFDRQDRAKQLTTPGFMARELASYYHTQQKEIAQELVTEAVKVGSLRAIQKQIKKLVRQAQKAQGAELREIGAKIEALQEQAERWQPS